jgi:hypothetical protein
LSTLLAKLRAIALKICPVLLRWRGWLLHRLPLCAEPGASPAVSVQPPHLDGPDVPWQSKRFNKATGVVGDGVYKG